MQNVTIWQSFFKFNLNIKTTDGLANNFEIPLGRKPTPFQITKGFTLEHCTVAMINVTHFSFQ